MAVEIPLHGKCGEGRAAIVDECDAELVLRHRWYAQKSGYTFYAAASVGGRTVLMHRLILGLKPGDYWSGDHDDHNGLNNTRSNLRLATYSQSLSNRRGWSKRGLPKGVTPDSKRPGLFWARIRFHKKDYYLGTFRSQGEAAFAYDHAARLLRGEFAYVNNSDKEVPEHVARLVEGHLARLRVAAGLPGVPPRTRPEEGGDQQTHPERQYAVG